MFYAWPVKLILMEHKAVALTVDNASNMDIAVKKLQVMPQILALNNVQNVFFCLFFVLQNIVMSQGSCPLTFWI